jgi:hypothetical protein
MSPNWHNNFGEQQQKLPGFTHNAVCNPKANNSGRFGHFSSCFAGSSV